MYLNTVRMIFIQPGTDKADEHPFPVRSLHMTGTTRMFIRKDVAVGRLHALLNRLRDCLDEIYSINVCWNDNELYVSIWTVAEDLVPKPEEIDVILKDKVLGDLYYLVRRYEE